LFLLRHSIFDIEYSIFLLIYPFWFRLRRARGKDFKDFTRDEVRNNEARVFYLLLKTLD